MSDFTDLDLDVTVRGFSPGQKVFGRYTLRSVLGRGGMGVVWLADDETLERQVALKFLPELVVRDRLALGDLKREATRSLALTHVNIVRVFDFIEDAARGVAAISMEYIDGGNLSDLRADREHRCFEVDELRPWVQQLCAALAFAHGKVKVVHRDLKPANLMLNGAGDLKVADFGIARSLVDSVSRVSAQLGNNSGTLVYMSPQQAKGQRASTADDIYSVGATLYDLLTGKPPFYTGNIYDQVKEEVPPSIAMRREEFEITGQPIPLEWEQLIAACLAKDPAQRPKSVWEIARRLNLPVPPDEQMLGPIEPTPIFRVPDPASGERNPLLRYATIAMGIAAISAGSWWFGIEQPKKERERLAIAEKQQRIDQEQLERANRDAEAVRQAKLAEEKRIADEAEKAAEAKRKAEQEAAKLDAEKKQQEMLAAQSKAEAEMQIRQKITQLLEAGKRAVEQKDWTDARQRFGAVIALDPENAQAKAGLSDVDAAEKEQMAPKPKPIVESTKPQPAKTTVSASERASAGKEVIALQHQAEMLETQAQNVSQQAEAAKNAGDLYTTRNATAQIAIYRKDVTKIAAAAKALATKAGTRAAEDAANSAEAASQHVEQYETQIQHYAQVAEYEASKRTQKRKK